jgi:hypothetical protein
MGQQAAVAGYRIPEQPVHPQAGNHRGTGGTSDLVQFPLQAPQALPVSGRCLANGFLEDLGTDAFKGLRILAGKHDPLVKIEGRAQV